MKRSDVKRGMRNAECGMAVECGMRNAERGVEGRHRFACHPLLRRALFTLCAGLAVLPIVMPTVVSAADEAPALRTPHSALRASEVEYVLGPEDQLAIAILAGPQFSEFAQPAAVTVRPDGKIALPRLGELTAGGKTAAQLQAEIEGALGRFFKRPPAVSVSITGFRLPGLIYVLGEVGRASAFPYRKGIGALEALALAGGPTPTADLTRVAVLRADSSRVETDLTGATQQGEPEGNVPLEPGDVVTVPRLPRRSISVIGGVNKAGPYEIPREVTVLEALKLAEGPREKADLRGATITTRDGKIIAVDLEKLHAGDTSVNRTLDDGDVLHIPERLMRVYVAGEVGKPDALVLREGATLLEAVTECGWFTKEADLKQVRIGRPGPGGQLETQTLDLSEIKGKTAQVKSVALRDGDFIVVPPRHKKKRAEEYFSFIYPLDVLRRILFP